MKSHPTQTLPGFRRWALLPLLIGILALAGRAFGLPAAMEIAPPCSLERTERSTTTPFGPWRERSDQRLSYGHFTPYLGTEFQFRHAIFKHAWGTKTGRDFLYHAAFSGRNMNSPMSFRVGRIWGGNSLFRPVDGGSWTYPWGRRLSTTLEAGRLATPDLKDKADKPGYFEGRLQYRFNEQATVSVVSEQEWREKYSAARLGYVIDGLRLLGEYRSSGATDTVRMSMQYYDGKCVDVTADYRLNRNDLVDTGIGRATAGVESGEIYLEGSVGGQSYFENEAFEDRSFCEGSITWGNGRRGENSVGLGYTVETGAASVSRTLSGTVERVVTKRTRIGLTLAETKFDQQSGSVQNLESRLHRRVDWGFYELRFGLIAGGENSDLEKDIGIRAGYEF
ncbi:MAG TPA: hypothetical protein PLP29_04990 [Candidatus Ozemobacteraceae bacterium]|nr:hypothetical protein [Candidatus Ozemobacteraceae bacterium]